MSGKRKETIQREDSPIINVCDTTTAIAVTSENVVQNESSSNAIPLPRTFNFHLSVPYLPQPAANNIANFSTTMAHFDNRLTGRLTDYPSTVESHTKTRTTTNNSGISFQASAIHRDTQRHQEKLGSAHARDTNKDKRDHPKHPKSKRRNVTELRHKIDPIYEYEHRGSSSEEDEPESKTRRRCFEEGEQNVILDGGETTPAGHEHVSYDLMAATRSKVPEEVRLRINSRERQRMHDLNSALDSLRQVMPYSSGPAVKKLSKMSTLLLARNYIVMLTKSVEDMKRLVQELSTNQRVPHHVPFPAILHESPISNPLLATSTSGLRIPTPFLHSATALQCVLTSSPCATCTCLQCLKKRQSANAAAALMGWKPG